MTSVIIVKRRGIVRGTRNSHVISENGDAVTAVIAVATTATIARAIIIATTATVTAARITATAVIQHANIAVAVPTEPLTGAKPAPTSASVVCGRIRKSTAISARITYIAHSISILPVYLRNPHTTIYVFR